MGLNCLMKNLQVNSQIYYISLCYEVMSVNIDNIGLSFQIVKMVEPDKRVQKLDKIVRESNGFFCLNDYHSKSRHFFFQSSDQGLIQCLTSKIECFWYLSVQFSDVHCTVTIHSIVRLVLLMGHSPH